jgi:hypothetical protein
MLFGNITSFTTTAQKDLRGGKLNKIAEGNVQPDDWQILIHLSQQI